MVKSKSANKYVGQPNADCNNASLIPGFTLCSDVADYSTLLSDDCSHQFIRNEDSALIHSFQNISLNLLIIHHIHL